MTFEEWWESYLNSEPSDTFLRDKEFAKFVWESAQPKWKPIETAPTDGTMVRVGWWEGDEWYEGEDFVEDGVWHNHQDHYDHFLAVRIPSMTGPKEESPYQYWMPIPEPPKEREK